MSWKTFVLGHHPDAVCVMVCDFWQVRTAQRSMGSGTTPMEAWKHAAEIILRRNHP